MTKKKTKSVLKKHAMSPKASQAPLAPTVLVLRLCRADLTSRDGFQWPSAGVVTCPDWEKNSECGNGLHGWLWGVGDAGTASDYISLPDAKWLVVEVAETDIVDLDGKVKFPAGVVLFAGDRVDATKMIAARAPDPSAAIIGGTATAGYRGTATAGYRGTATAGAMGTATAGDMGTATAGYAGTATAGDVGTATAGARGTATAGDMGTATAGASGTATAGYAGTATAGDVGTATAGARGTATAGYAGTATAGYRGTATAGAMGTATAGDVGTATAGLYGTVAIEFYDEKRGVCRRAIAEIDGETYMPGVAYVVRDGVLIPASEAKA